MNSITLGPLALAIPRLVAVALMILALLAARLWERRGHRGLESLLWQSLVAGLITARLAYALGHADYFQQRPLETLYLWQGGFSAWAGVIGSMVYATARGKRAALRKALLTLIATAALAWAAFAWLNQQLQQAGPGLPELDLQSLSGEWMALRDFRGKPTVVNLWATWCPPCRREMPVLQAAQRQHANLHIVFVNQGEDRASIGRYLHGQGLQLENLLLDPLHQYSEQTGARGLPTTFFYDADGQLVDTHLGELSEPMLADFLKRLAPP
ncbi:TlpA disulfide reductase family protein [Alkalilimnicola sp. S0819]|uniref:TlpA disulfide reductase family protein n=1 Tax=Alkalilimnicola sp. S0819 TaxID=2613922 RepID=UPI00126187F3|nr:TlpA disulfide reductase family protein [Alkalilimnicola sp. S0819]KAB7623137.1 redoxin domain-containing protein [Alkalilimnicola sp. S0819]MPQ16981.1 redoxin domain-containing protein [Alkalilimnicola sp. S0819]